MKKSYEILVKPRKTVPNDIRVTLKCVDEIPRDMTLTYKQLKVKCMGKIRIPGEPFDPDFGIGDVIHMTYMRRTTRWKIKNIEIEKGEDNSKKVGYVLTFADTMPQRILMNIVNLVDKRLMIWWVKKMKLMYFRHSH